MNRHTRSDLTTSKLFQRSVVPMPSFSKERLGGFVGFQRDTLDPNASCGPPNFYLHNAARGSARLDQSSSVEQHGKTLALLLFFRKKNPFVPSGAIAFGTTLRAPKIHRPVRFPILSVVRGHGLLPPRRAGICFEPEKPNSNLIPSKNVGGEERAITVVKAADDRHSNRMRRHG
jgi:hypothetical protein